MGHSSNFSEAYNYIDIDHHTKIIKQYDNNNKLDVLVWWKVNQESVLVIYAMTRDLLTIFSVYHNIGICF